MSEFNPILSVLNRSNSTAPFAPNDQGLFAPLPNPDRDFWNEMKRRDEADFERMAIDLGRANVQGW